MDQTRTLVCIEVATPTTVWNRTLLSDYVPTESELTFYYSNLLGFPDITVKLHTEQVPFSFNTHLLATLDNIPNKFPVHDLETTPDNTTKRTQYKTYINQLCDMERNRVSLQVFSDTQTPSPQRLSSPSKLRTPAWVEILLKSLNTEHDYDIVEEAQHGTDEIVSGLYEGFTPVGWIFTPTVADVRANNGSLIVTSQDVGKTWERLLSTDMYPDLVVSRRVTTANWAFQHPTSEILLKSTIDWYIASKDTHMINGVSGWIPYAESEVNSLLSTFKKIKINERLILETNKPNDKTAQIFKILNAVESRLLALHVEDSDIDPLSTDIFQKYMHYTFRGFGLPKELYGPNTAVIQIIERWGRSDMGFKKDIDPLLETWKPMWHACIRGNPTKERVVNFLRTLDAWDPIESTLFSTQQKNNIANEWIKAFLDMETQLEDKATAHAVSLYQTCKEWCFKFVPESVFATSISPMTIGPILKTSRGLDSKKKAGGRFFEGIRMKHDVEGVVRKTTGISLTTETIDGTTAERTNVFQVVTQGNDRVEHFYCSTSTTIDLQV
jgi:hypothetical protein